MGGGGGNSIQVWEGAWMWFECDNCGKEVQTNHKLRNHHGNAHNLVMIADTHWPFVNQHLLRNLAAPIWKDEEGSIGEPNENPQSWSLCQISSSQGCHILGATWNCKICGRVFAVEKQLIVHVIVFHGIILGHPSFYFNFSFGTEMLRCLESYI